MDLSGFVSPVQSPVDAERPGVRLDAKRCSHTRLSNAMRFARLEGFHNVADRQLVDVSAPGPT